jgi:hypothetical protein
VPIIIANLNVAGLSADELEDAATQLVRKASDLRAVKNHLTSRLVRLPAELQRAILFELRALVLREWEEDAEKTVDSYAWLPIVQVCRRLRRVALDYLQLWTFVDLTRTPLAEELSVRAQALPLEVALIHGPSDYSDPVKSAGVLNALAPHVRKLTVQLDGVDIEEVLDQLDGPLQLESFRLCATYALTPENDDEMFYITPSFLGGYAPALHHLQVERCAFDAADEGLPALANVRSLSAHYSRLAPVDEEPALPQILRTLEQMPDLESLVLSDLIVEDDSIALAHDAGIADLQNLREVEVADTMATCLALLDHLPVPTDRLCVRATAVNASSVTELYQRLLLHMRKFRELANPDGRSGDDVIRIRRVDVKPVHAHGGTLLPEVLIFEAELVRGPGGGIACDFVASASNFELAWMVRAQLCAQGFHA